MSFATLKPAGCRLILTGVFALGGCSGYVGSSRSIRPEELRSAPGWTAVHDVPLIQQVAEHDCGAAALAMVLAHYRPELAESAMALGADNQRLSAKEMRDHARTLGFSAFVVEGAPSDLVFELEHGRPVIVGMAKPSIEGRVAHYEVVIGINATEQLIATLDPAEGFRQNSFEGFLDEWHGAGRVLIVIVRAPPPSGG